MMRKNRNERGGNLVEFTLAGIPVVFLLFSTVQLSMAMWNYHTLTYAVNEVAHYAAVRGQNCSANGNSCGTTVGALAQQVASNAIGIPANQVEVKLTTASGQVTSCAPLNSCYSSTTAWPPSTNSDNASGKNVTVSAKYVFPTFLALFWPGAGSSKPGTIVLTAASTQRVLF